MNDYLSSLVARAFGRAPALQPRLPSLFEPSPRRLELTDSVVEVAKVPTPARTITPGVPWALRSEHATTPILPDGSLDPTPSRPFSEAKCAPAISAAQAQSRRRLVPPSTERADAVPPPPPARGQDAGDALEPPPRTVLAHVRLAADNRGQPSAPIDAVPSSLQPQSPVHELSDAERPAPAQPSQEAARIALAPVIRVTIGRIDVRLVSPVRPAPPSSPPPKPMLSLEDYLRARNGGGA